MLISSNYNYCVWIFLLFSSELVAEKSIYQEYASSQMVQDIPTFEDLRIYLTALNRVVNFSYNYFRDYTSNASYQFALFLLNVNLRPFADDDSIMSSLRYYLKNILEKNDKILVEFNVKGDNLTLDLQKLQNLTSWSKRLKNFKFELVQKWGLKNDRNKEFPDWKTYVRNVDYYNEWIPHRDLSDLCLRHLVRVKENHSKHLRKCSGVPEGCYKMLIDGPDFGYGLTHRLLFLQCAYFGRRCAVLSAVRDRALMRRFCNIMHIEAEFIAYHRYKNPDLMFEHIALCSLNGHAEFVRRTWLTNLLRYQTPQGCFGLRLRTQNTDENEKKPVYDLMNQTCDSHVTAVAVAAIAAAARFLLEQL